jgi:pimeloyl-ACP methyl ester carboxylesterase
LFLYGVGCKLSVWEDLLPLLDGVDALLCEYPREVTQNARTFSVIAQWVYEQYKDERLDFLVGHSMGGRVALSLVTEYALDCGKLILLESSPKPAGAFYRNLMTPGHMTAYGDRVLGMLKEETPFYSEAFRASLRDDFDDSDLIRRYSGSVYAVLGDRGCPSHPESVEDPRMLLRRFVF